MKILCLSTWFPYPPSNGSEIRAHYLLKALARDHRVTVAAFRWDATQDVWRTGLPQGIQVHAVNADPFRYTDLPTLAKFASPLPVADWPSRVMLSTLRQLQASESWDAVVAIQSPAALYALLLPIPRVLDMDTALSYQLHEQFSRTTSPLARIRALVSWQKAHWYEAYLMRRYQAVTAVSDQELDFLRSMVSGTSCQVVLNPNGVDCVHNRPGFVAPQPRTLVYNGALTYSANYDAMQYFLAEVYPAIKAQVPDTTMKITGSTKGVDLAGLRLDDSVRLTGYVEDVRVPVAGSAVCVVPLREGGGTRLKILEAMALGTPVVATSKGAEGLNVTHERDILIADSSSGLVAEVLRLFRDQALCERLSANARRLVEREYDWGLIGGQFARLVESVVEAQRSRLA